jgi:TonB-linked SusC/RagA family outer membrane protein
MQVFATGKTSALGRALHQLNCFFPKHRQAVRIMKLTTILLLAACLQLSARGISQTISISVKDAPLLSVLKAIEKQTDFVFIVDNQWLQKTKKVTITATNLPLLKVLELCFKDQPLTYNISGKVIVISPKEVKAKNISAVNEEQQGIDVRGRVVNENGEPVQASVTVKGTKEGTTTNANGEFRLQNVDENAVLVISGVGIEERELKVAGKNNLYAVVKIAVKPLDEVQMIAYGTTTKRLNTGDVTSVKASDIEKQPVDNPLLALQGRVPGVLITQNTGVPGGGITVRIQGQNSILNGNDPLYVIDGVPYILEIPQTLQAGANIYGRSGGQINGLVNGVGNPLSLINPQDIESIEVLKDADATAIYGSRGANGVILITTKRGRPGKTNVILTAEKGVSTVASKFDMLNTSQYLNMRYEALRNDSKTPNPNSDYDLTLWDTTSYTNWQKELIGGTASYTNVNASISGGTSDIIYQIGSTYRRETTVYPGDFEDKRSSLHFNLQNSNSKQKFQFKLSGSFLVNNSVLPSTDLTREALTTEPDAPSLYNSDGSINWALNSTGTSTWNNPIRLLYQNYQNSVNNLIGNAELKYSIIPSLNILCSLGYNNVRGDDYAPTPWIAIQPNRRSAVPRSAQYGSLNVNSKIAEPQIRYKDNIWKGNLEILLGSSFQIVDSRSETILAQGFASDEVLKDIHAAGTLTALANQATEYKYNALFGRLNYNIKDKYIINFTGRRDGSSRFGPANRFHNFSAIGGAWIFSKELVFQKHISFLSFGKVRASYGTTGNDQIGDYSFINLYNPISAGVAYQGVTGYQVRGLFNPYLEWEETQKLQLGADFGLLHDRILVDLTFARNKSSNQLLSYALPSTTGFQSLVTNFPAEVQNINWELAINTVNIKMSNFSWSTSINLTWAKNELLSFPNLDQSSYANSLVIGQPLSVQKIYNFLGVDPITGKYIVADKNGNPTSTPNYLNDALNLVNITPVLFGGLENTLNYKGVQLDFLFQYVKQNAPNFFFYNGNVTPGRFSATSSNQPVSVLNNWKKSGDDVQIEKYSTSQSSSIFNATASSKGITDASFVRLKNASLSWQVPNKWINNLKLQNIKVYLLGQNLFTITDYKGLDPETKSLAVLPPLRTIILGLQIGF